MKKLFFILAIVTCVATFSCSEQQKKDGDWIVLFNGKDLSGWEANENEGSFKVVDSVLVANGLRSHLFYVGNGKEQANFKNFEFSVDIMTHNLANSGVYFHTAHQKE